MAKKTAKKAGKKSARKSAAAKGRGLSVKPVITALDKWLAAAAAFEASTPAQARALAQAIKKVEKARQAVPACASDDTTSDFVPFPL